MKLLKVISSSFILYYCPVVQSTSTNDMYFNILSMDGGGIRGLITATLI
jgi:hypothetical protein